MRFAKWHGLGNDYLLVEQEEVGAPLEPDLVRRLCDYHFGVGSDGVLEVLVGVGTVVAADEEVAVVESMKVEIPVTAPRPGRVATVAVGVGDQVQAGDVLLTIV